MNDTNPQQVPQAESAPCVEYGLLPTSPNWNTPINTPETFATLVEEHKAWRAWYALIENGQPVGTTLANAVVAGFRAARAMARAQRSGEASEPVTPSTSEGK